MKFKVDQHDIAIEENAMHARASFDIDPSRIGAAGATWLYYSSDLSANYHPVQVGQVQQ